MARPTPTLLHPDYQTAEQVEHALRVLHTGDALITQADRFLSSVRSSAAAWPVCCALIRSPDASHAALMFAASTVHARTSADWLAFTDDAHRNTAFALALEGLCRPARKGAPIGSASPVYFFGRACGFCLSMAQTPASREHMWQALTASLAGNAALMCNALAAAVQEVDETSTTDVEMHVMVRSFCRSKAPEVVPTAITILQNTDRGASSGAALPAVQDLRAAVLCIHAWQKYSEKENIVPVLINAIRIAALADDVAETLNETIGYTGSNVKLLMATCDGLISAYQAVQGSEDEAVVHHAIAEVACALSDGNADELMEQEDVNSNVVAQKATELLWLCLKSKDDRAFFAAVEGWSSWIAAANLVAQSHCRVVKDQVAAVVSVVVQRMKSLEFVAASISSDSSESMERADEKVRVTDLLLEATSSLGIERYVKVIVPLIDGPWNSSPHAFCAALLAFSVAGEDGDGWLGTVAFEGIVLDVLRRIMDLVESCVSAPAQEGNAYKPLKRSAMGSLCAYASVLAVHASDREFYRALRCAGTGMLDPEVSEKAAEFLCELADANAERLGQFLPELVSSGTGAVPRMSEKAAEYCVRGLSKVASGLASHEERLKVMEAILEGPCSHVMWVCRKQKVGEDEESVCKALGLISAGMQEVNDNEAATGIFGRLRPSVFEIAVEHCANGTVSKAVCRLLEVCVLPTLMDDEQPAPAVDAGGENAADDRRERISEVGQQRLDGGRLVLAMSCMSLAAECFRRSGKDGETCWLQSVGDIAPHVLECLEGNFSSEVEGRALACLSVSLQHSLEGLQAFTDGHFDRRADMAIAYFKFATTVLGHSGAGSAVAHCASACARAGLAGVQCDDVRIVREALAWWKAACGPSAGANATGLVLAGGGGADAVARGIVCAARHARCAGAVADALFALCKWVAAAAGDVDPGNVLRACLAAAFSSGGAPGAGLDARVREMVYRSCVNSAGSKRDLRKALKEFGRICAMAL